MWRTRAREINLHVSGGRKLTRSRPVRRARAVSRFFLIMCTKTYIRSPILHHLQLFTYLVYDSFSSVPVFSHLFSMRLLFFFPLIFIVMCCFFFHTYTVKHVTAELDIPILSIFSGVTIRSSIQHCVPKPMQTFLRFVLSTWFLLPIRDHLCLCYVL